MKKVSWSCLPYSPPVGLRGRWVAEVVRRRPTNAQLWKSPLAVLVLLCAGTDKVARMYLLFSVFEIFLQL